MSEGEVTEREYLEGFRGRCRNPLVEFDYVGGAGAPMTLVEHARDLKRAADAQADREDDDYLRYDEVWCVFDVDAHPRVADARNMAHANGLRLAMTNPCFELWLLLHLRDSPGGQDRHAVQRMLQALMTKVRLKHIDFEQLIAGYEDAFRRASRLEKDAHEAGEHQRNPTTEVHHLTGSIDEEGRLRRAAAPKGSPQDESRSREKAAAAARDAFELVAEQERERAAQTINVSEEEADAREPQEPQNEG